MSSPATRPRTARGARSRAERLNDQVPELMGAKEVAALLGVESSNLDRVPGLPPEAQRLERGRIWRADLIREFAELRAGD